MRYRLAVYLVAFVAGLLDWIENTLEIIFVNNAAVAEPITSNDTT